MGYLVFVVVAGGSAAVIVVLWVDFHLNALFVTIPIYVVAATADCCSLLSISMRNSSSLSIILLCAEVCLPPFYHSTVLLPLLLPSPFNVFYSFFSLLPFLFYRSVSHCVWMWKVNAVVLEYLNLWFVEGFLLSNSISFSLSFTGMWMYRERIKLTFIWWKCQWGF